MSEDVQIVYVPRGSTQYRLGDHYVFLFPFEFKKVPDGWIVEQRAVIVQPGVEVRFVNDMVEMGATTSEPPTFEGELDAK